MSDFLDKMKMGINKGVATVSTGSKTMVEKTKINSVIKTLEDEKNELTRILGNKIFVFCSENTEGDIPRAEVQSFCDEIEKRNVQIEQQKVRIQELDAEMSQVMGTTSASISAICSCGYENSPGAKFCARCGKKLA